MRTHDGLELTAKTPAGIVHELRVATRGRRGRSEADFMAIAASRAELQTGKRIRCDTAEHFVADLLTAGLLLDNPEETL
jgi:hypothetical protein